MGGSGQLDGRQVVPCHLAPITWLPGGGRVRKKKQRWQQPPNAAFVGNTKVENVRLTSGVMMVGEAPVLQVFLSGKPRREK